MFSDIVYLLLINEEEGGGGPEKLDKELSYMSDS